MLIRIHNVFTYVHILIHVLSVFCEFQKKLSIEVLYTLSCYIGLGFNYTWLCQVHWNLIKKKYNIQY